MDLFKKTQFENLGHGGIKCSCCNVLARKLHGRVDKTFNRVVRSKVKNITRKEILNINY